MRSLFFLCRVFQLTSADKYTLSHMESHPKTFKLADVQNVLHRLKVALDQSKTTDNLLDTLSANADPSNCVSLDTFMQISSGVAGLELQRHEAITLARKLAYADRSNNGIALEPLRGVLTE